MIPAFDYEQSWQALRELPCPILVVRAGERSHISVEAAAKLATLAPRVRMAVVPDARHSVMGDNPLVFERVVVDFLMEEGML
jgi:pimeloyl-ACP methyl ester carboxylesterase